MGLLVVQVLHPVLDPAQKPVGRSQRIGGGLGHEVGAAQPLQRVQRGPGAQLGELPPAHHLQQLHRELDFPDAAARQLHIVGPARVAGRAFGGVFADLAVQGAQRVEHVVVEVFAEHKGQHRPAQGAGAAVFHPDARRDHPALEPGKALPFTALHEEVLLQSPQRHRARPRVAVGPQGQVDPEHLAVLGGLAHGVVDVFDRLAKVLVVADAVAALFVAGGFAVVVVDVDQVDVAGHVELARAQLAHAHHPHLGALGP